MEKQSGGAIPISIELLNTIRRKQFELSKERGKILTLSEVSNEIVRKGLDVMEKENLIKETKEEK